MLREKLSRRETDASGRSGRVTAATTAVPYFLPRKLPGKLLPMKFRLAAANKVVSVSSAVTPLRLKNVHAGCAADARSASDS